MNIKSKLILSICSIITLSLLCGCVNVNEEKGKVYNDNVKIAKESDSFSYLERSSEENSKNEFQMSFKCFYGTDTIWSIKAEKDTEITFNFDSSIDEGEVKAVLIKPDNEIETIFEGSGKSNKIMELSKGNYRVKFVGNKARGKVKVSIDRNDNFKIKRIDEWH